MRGRGSLMLTGSLGDVMKESAQTAVSYLRSQAKKLDLDFDDYSKYDMHIHVPAGATPKDGPSAGVTIVAALASLLSKRRVRSDVAMTGEISLRGRVMRVGGIKEKVLAASRFGVKQVILPEGNKAGLAGSAGGSAREIEGAFRQADFRGAAARARGEMKSISQGGASVPANCLLQNCVTAHRVERIVPREHLTIARHFNAGFLCKLRQIPEGRLKHRHRFSRPCGTCPTTNLFPALKRWAIFRKSLRDCGLCPSLNFIFCRGRDGGNDEHFVRRGNSRTPTGATALRCATNGKFYQHRHFANSRWQRQTTEHSC